MSRQPTAADVRTIRSVPRAAGQVSLSKGLRLQRRAGASAMAGAEVIPRPPPPPQLKERVGAIDHCRRVSADHLANISRRQVKGCGRLALGRHGGVCLSPQKGFGPSLEGTDFRPHARWYCVVVW